MSFKQKLYLLALAGLISAVALGVIGLTSVHQVIATNNTQEELGLIRHHQMLSDMMHDAVRGDVLRLQLAIKNNDKKDITLAQEAIRKHSTDILANLKESEKLGASGHINTENIQPAVEQYVTLASNIAAQAPLDPARVADLMPEFNKSFDSLDVALARSNDHIGSAIDSSSVGLRRIEASIRNRIMLAGVIFAIGFAALAWWIIRGVMDLLGTEPENAQAITERIARGDLHFTIPAASPSTLLGALSNMLVSLREAQSSAVDNLRIKQALNATSSCVMLADNQRNIIYMNTAVEKMLRNVETELRKALPHFSVDKVLGSNIDIFHRNPSHQSNLLSGLRSAYVSNIQVGSLSFRLLANPIFGESGERMGSVVEWQERTKEVAAEHELSRILGALEATTTNVMIADTDRKIIYMNKSVESMLRHAEADIRSVLPQFAVDRVVGSNMDIFHKNPAHQMRLLESLQSSYTGNIVVGRRHFRLVANPIFSKDGTRLGSVVEWQDRTQEVAIEAEVSQIVEAATAGSFTERISTENKTGFFLKLAEGLNQLTTTAHAGLNDVNRVLSALSKGDLTEKIESDYRGTFGDLKDYSNSTTSNLTEMLGEIRNAADIIFTAASEIAQGNSDLSARTEQQAANLEETASSMEELTSTVKLNADNARQANVLAEQAAAVATDGGELIGQVVNTMTAINESSQKIADIIGVIDGIAFQTNILALNAAVEAARAGDQGRGFAVVASEVRTLAQRSANAAKDIKGLISDSVRKIENGNQLVGQSGETMKEIVTSIKRVKDIMAEIAEASVEQSTGIEEVATAVSQMDEMTQQNAALVEEAAAAAESLQSQSEQLTQRVARFRLAGDALVSRSHSPKALAKSVATTAAQRKSLPKSGVSQEDDWESF